MDMARIGIIVDEGKRYHSQRKGATAYHVGKKGDPCGDGQQIKAKHLAKGPRGRTLCQECAAK